MFAGDGKANGANAGVEIENFISGDVLPDLLESQLINWEVDLEKAVGGVRIGVIEDDVGESGEVGMGAVVLVEAARDFASLVAAEK